MCDRKKQRVKARLLLNIHLNIKKIRTSVYRSHTSIDLIGKIESVLFSDFRAITFVSPNHAPEFSYVRHHFFFQILNNAHLHNFLVTSRVISLMMLFTVVSPEKLQ